jgi:transposase-like protein
MEDYPRNLTEFGARFGTEQACREYLFRLRWPAGFRCPRCGCGESWAVREVLLQCVGCGHQTSVTAGTIFQDTRTPLRLWFQAMWWITTQKNGASALGLQRVLGLRQYQTAWTWLHKLRSAMVRPPGGDLLGGRVEVDESCLGRVEEGVRGRKTQTKALIIVAAQEDGRGIGRIRMRRIPDASAGSLHRFVGDSIASGSVVRTDGWQGYSGLNRKGYVHEVTLPKARKPPASELPRVHRVISLLKRWLMETHQGAVSHKHLDYYLDEFTFRFNRKSASRGKLFFRLAQQAVAVEPSPYDMIVGRTRRAAQESKP